MSKHFQLSEQKLEEGKHQEDENFKLSKQSKLSHQLNRQEIDFKWKSLLFWVPIITALLFVVFGIIKENLSEQQKFYCFKNSFTATGFPKQRNSQSRQILVNTRYGFQMYVDSLDTGASKKIAETGSYEPALINLIGQIVLSGDNVVLVGSNLGLDAIVAGKVIGETGTLHVFTPLQNSFNLIKKNINENNLQKVVKVEKKAASDRKETGSIDIITSSGKVESQPIFYDKIDDNFPQNKQLNFVYIDQEKMEVRALNGMRKIIERSPRLVIMVKWQSNRNNLISRTDVQSLFNFLANKGYKAYSYKGGSYTRSCQVGSFTWRGDLENLYEIKNQTLLFFPEGYSLPQ